MPEAHIDLVADDRSSVKLGDRAFLIIGDDRPLAKTMMTVARSHGFKAMVAASGSRGLELANQYQPSAIGLDINLSDMSGWTVLDQLKRNSAVRHVPIYVLSVADEERSRALRQGAFGFTANR